MDNTSKRIANNIKHLRELHGESLEKLSHAVGFKGKQSAENWEKNGVQKINTLIKIANHYDVSLDFLCTEDLSDYSLPTSLFEKSTLFRLTAEILPVVSSERALQDPVFKKAYSFNMEIQSDLKEGQLSDDALFDEMIEGYFESYEKNKTIEALANLLWVLIGLDQHTKNERVNQLAEDIITQKKSALDILNDFTLHDLDFEDSLKEENKNYSPVIENTTIAFIKELKNEKTYADLADYYNALRYVNGIVTNDLPVTINQTIGMEMLSFLYDIDNTYAIKYIDYIAENF